MPDYLLIHDAGHGAWAWAYVKAALEDALRGQDSLYHELYRPGAILAPDLPYHGARQGQGNPETLTFDGVVDELLATAERAQLRSPTVVAHGLTALIALEVARRMRSRPQRIILVAGAVPSFVGTPTEELPLLARVALIAHMLRPGAEPGTVRLHREVAWRLWCRGMDYPEAAVMVLGKLGPLPLKMLDSLPHPDALTPPCRVTYVALRKDGLLPYRTQLADAQRLKADVVTLDAGHEAPLSHPKEIAGVLLGNAAVAARPRAAA